MNDRMRQVFEAFMRIKFAHVKPKETYYTEWEKRFEQGYEWQHSDYSNRFLLKSILPDVYPDDKDEYFVRE